MWWFRRNDWLVKSTERTIDLKIGSSLTEARNERWSGEQMGNSNLTEAAGRRLK